jgi:hypothetical protein
MHGLSFRIALVTALACASLATDPLPGQKNAASAVDLTVTSPEAQGFSAEGLERLHTYMQQTVDSK